jgi:hypothetical protein
MDVSRRGKIARLPKRKVSLKVNKSVGQKAGMCSDVSALRRGDHRAERLKLEQARLEQESVK